MRALILSLVACAVVFAQGGGPGPITAVTTAPSGSCTSNTGQLVGPGGTIYTCQNGTWAQASGGGALPSGTGAVQVTSGVAGLVAGTASNCVLVNGSSAPCDAPGVTAAVNVTPVTVSANSTSAQVLQQLSLSAGFLNTSAASGGVFTYNGSGIYTAAALQTPTLTWTLNLCTVSGCGSGTTRALAVIVTPSVVTATNNTWNIRLSIANTATGATGTVITHGTSTVELTLASDLGTSSNDSNTASSGTIDLTAALFLQLTVTTSTGNTGNSITEDHSSLEPASQIGPTGPTGAAGTSTQIAAGSVCADAGCTVNETANWAYAVMVAGTIQSCGAVATIAPTGAAIIVDVLKNGTSIYGANPKTTVAINSTTYAAVSTFSSASVVVGDLLTFKVTQPDSNPIGQFVRVSCTIQ